MGAKPTFSPIKSGNDAHDYFKETTARSVVIELINNTVTEFHLQDSLIIHGDELLNPLPKVIQKDTINYICHGSNGIMTGIEAWAKYMNTSGIMMKLLWENNFIGISHVAIEANVYIIKKTILEDSTSGNLHIRIEIENQM